MTTTLLILSVLLSAAPQTELHTFLARRDYDSAVLYYRARVQRASSDVDDMRNLARVYDRWHKFDSSLAWWSRVLEKSPVDDSAIVGRWYAMYRRDEKDSLRLADTKKLIASEATPFLRADWGDLEGRFRPTAASWPSPTMASQSQTPPRSTGPPAS